MQAIHGLTPELGGDAEVPLRGLDRLVAGERLDIGNVAAGLQEARQERRAELVGVGSC
jgi:hypothetical protein